MREIRQYGSEGGAGSIPCSYLYHPWGGAFVRFGNAGAEEGRSPKSLVSMPLCLRLIVLLKKSTGFKDDFTIILNKCTYVMYLKCRLEMEYTGFSRKGKRRKAKRQILKIMIMIKNKSMKRRLHRATGFQMKKGGASLERFPDHPDDARNTGIAVRFRFA